MYKNSNFEYVKSILMINFKNYCSTINRKFLKFLKYLHVNLKSNSIHIKCHNKFCCDEIKNVKNVFTKLNNYR